MKIKSSKKCRESLATLLNNNTNARLSRRRCRRQKYNLCTFIYSDVILLIFTSFTKRVTRFNAPLIQKPRFPTGLPRSSGKRCRPKLINSLLKKYAFATEVM